MPSADHLLRLALVTLGAAPAWAHPDPSRIDWQVVDEPAGAAGNAERRTRGGSWCYRQTQMRAEHLPSNAADTAVVYIGFRCVRSGA